MIDLARAAAALTRMHNVLVRMTREEHAALAAPGRYERETNGYQDALVAAYQRWSKAFLKNLPVDTDAANRAIAESLPSLRNELASIAQAELPYAIQVLGSNYVPSPDAWRMVADAIGQTSTDLDGSLIPDLQAKLERGLAEGADLAGVLQSLEPRVGYLAGTFWVLIMRAIGDYAAQAESQDDVIYPCDWVRVHDDHSCEACVEYEGEYESYNAMLEKTHQSVPGYFFNSPFKNCRSNCRCYLRLKINGAWRRV